MRRRRKSSSSSTQKRAIGAFGKVTHAFDLVFNTLVSRVQRVHKVRDLTVDNFIDLLVPPGDVETLRRTRQLLGDGEARCNAELPFWDIGNNKRLFLDMYVDTALTGMYALPKYATSHNRSRQEVEHFVTDMRLYQDLQMRGMEWYSLRAAIEVTKWMLNKLNKELKSPAQVRYLMPSVLPILRYIGRSNSEHASAARVLAFELQENDPKAYASIPSQVTTGTGFPGSFDARRALAIANDTMAVMTVLDAEVPGDSGPVDCTWNGATFNDAWYHNELCQTFSVPTMAS